MNFYERMGAPVIGFSVVCASEGLGWSLSFPALRAGLPVTPIMTMAIAIIFLQP